MRYPRPAPLALILCLCCIAAAPARAQDAPAPTPTEPGTTLPGYGSPRDTMRTFLTAITTLRDTGRADLWPDVLACFNFTGAGIDPESFTAKRRAEQMLDALDHIRLVDYDELPDAQALRPGQQSYTYFPRPFSADDADLATKFELTDQHVTLVEIDGAWRFSAETVDKLPELYAAAVAKGELQVRHDDAASVLQRYMPRSLVVRRWLEIMYWQWIGLMVLILVGLAADLITRAVIKVVIANRIGVKKGKEHGESITYAARPVGLFAAGLFWLLTLRLLGMPVQAHQFLHAAAAVFAVLAGTWAAWRLTDLGAAVVAAQAAKTSTKLDDILVPLLRKALKIFVVAIGVIYGAEALDIPIGPMLASLGIGGLAFAFAAKDTIENFFGSIAVILDRPFEVGDWVVIEDTEGTVEELGFRSTRIRTFYNSQVTVPNASLVRATVDNYGRRKYRRWKTTLGVQYDTPPEAMLAFTEGIRELVRTHPYTRKDYYQVWCNDFGDSSLNVLLYVFFEVPDWNTELRERERLFIDIVRLADQLGVSFAFPTRTVHLFTEEHKDHESRYGQPTKISDRRAFVTGIRSAQQIIANQAWQEAKPPPQTYGQVGPTALDTDDTDPANATENTQAPPPTPEEQQTQRRKFKAREDQTEQKRAGNDDTD